MKPSTALAILASRFPKAFTAPLPLKIGVYTDVIASGALDDKSCRRALAAWCRGPRYMRAVAAGGDRIDLDEQVTQARHDIAAIKARRGATQACEVAERANAKATATSPKANGRASLETLRASARARRQQEAKPVERQRH